MGGNSSKSSNNHLNIPLKSYENFVRGYAKWEYHSSRIIDDSFRSTKYEINNWIKHNRSSKKLSSLNIQSQSENFPRKKVHFNDEILFHSTEYLSKPQQRQSLNHNQFIKYQIPRHLQSIFIQQIYFQNIEEIGKGNFGIVYRALFKEKKSVALKTLNHHEDKSMNSYLNNLFHEAQIMLSLKHENLLTIIGITYLNEKKQFALVMDFMENGNLLNYLRNNRQNFLELSSKDIRLKLNHFALQIFEAMLFLEEKSIIHRDLAARNCLISQNEILKLSDFGLTKLTEYGLYKGNHRTIFALRWSPPEVVFALKFSSRSDVWSYGITLWEIYSLGEHPYGNLNSIILKNLLKNQIENLCDYLPLSNQLSSDPISTHIIIPCLTFNVYLRPRFKDLYSKIYSILNFSIQ